MVEYNLSAQPKVKCVMCWDHPFALSLILKPTNLALETWVLYSCRIPISF